MAEQTVEVELEPSESEVVSFEATPHEAKTYSVSVDGLSGSFRATTAPVNLSGIVTNAITGSPTSGVKVYFDSQKTYTDASGAYRISRLVVGEIYVAFTHIDYEAYYAEITLSLGDNRLNAALTPAVTGQIALKGQQYNLVTYTGRSQTFAEAFASLASQFFMQVVHIVDSYQYVACSGTGGCTTSTKMMIPGDLYWIFVRSDCIWKF